MPPMPYVVTQGPIVTALEQAFNRGHKQAKDGTAVRRTAKQVRLDTLSDLRQEDPVISVGSAGNFLTQEIADHIDRHWFGIEPGSRVPIRPGEPTGWWINWQGPAEEIARKGFIVALEVSLGLAPGEVPADDADLRLFPMDFSWICPVPRFEIWVGCRDWSEPPSGADTLSGDDDNKIVTVTMATPGYANLPPDSLPLVVDDPTHVGQIGLVNTLPEKKTVGPQAQPVEKGDSYRKNDHIVVGVTKTSPLDASFCLNGEPDAPGNERNCWKLMLNAGVLASGEVVTVRVPIEDGVSEDGSSYDKVMQGGKE